MKEIGDNEMLNDIKDTFDALFNVIEDYLFIVDATGKIINANRSAIQKLGYTLEELCHMNIMLLYPPEQREMAFESVKGMIAGNVIKGLVPLYTKKGDYIPVETRIFKSKWKGIDVTFGICKDISETVSANQRFIKFFQKNPAILLLSNMNSQEIVDVNESLLHNLGFRRNELVGKKISDFKIFMDEQDLKIIRQEIEEHGFISNLEITFGNQKSGIHYGLVSADVIDDGGNRYLLIAINDITKRKKLEIDMKNQQRFLKSIIDTIPDHIFFKDTEGRYLGCNKAFAENLSGVSEDEIIGKTNLDLIKDPDLANYFTQIDLEILGCGKTKIDENKVMMANGSFIDFETVLTPFFDEENKPAGLIGIGRNITQRKSFEKQLQAQREYAEMLLNTVPSAVFSVDRDQRITSWNKWAELITGYAADEVIGKECSHISGDYCKGKCGLYAEDIVKPVINKICTIKSKQGETRFISKNVDVIKNERGEVIGGIECFSDIHDRLQMEERLRESEERYSAIVNCAPEIVVIHKNEKIVFINESGLQASGYQKNEVIGQSILKFLSQKSLETVRTIIKQRMLGEAIGDYEVEFIVKSGLVVNLIVKATLITYENEPAILAVLIDISERKQIEVKLQAQTSLLNGLLDSIPEIVFFKDINGVFLGCNAETARLVGRETQDIIGHTDYDFYNRDVADFYRENERIMLERGVPKHSEEWNHYPDGRRVLLETLKAPLRNQDGRVIGLIGVSRNITERKQLENDLRKAKETAETANSAKSRFLANMSHEIRTPMNGIIGFVELLSKTQLTREQSEFLWEVQTASDLLMQLINDILDYSKIEADKLELEIAPINLQSLIEDSVALFAPQAYKKGIEINSFIAGDIPQSICGDPGRLRQVLHNLIGNAVKFTEKGEISVKMALLENHKNRAEILLQISDTGIGMNEAVLSKLFQVFTQADATTTRKYGGTGLGLAISQHIVQLMGGEISVESSPGLGSTFDIVIPFEKRGTDEESQFKSHPKLMGLRVLVADSYQNNRIIYRKYLEDAGCQVTEADNLEKVRHNLVESHAVDKAEVIIIDFDMVDRRNTKQNQSLNLGDLNNRAVMFLATTDLQKTDARKYFPKLFRGYIKKPIRKNDLLNTILSVVSNESTVNTRKSKNSPETNFNTSPQLNHQKEIEILLVEDIPANQKLAAVMLQKLGYTVDLAENGQQALLMCQNNKYDLILMDCQMPVMDGYEASAIIKRVEGINKETVIIAMTAYAMESDREKCLSAGMDDYLSKPVTMSKLDSIVKKWRNKIQPNN